MYYIYIVQELLFNIHVMNLEELFLNLKMHLYMVEQLIKHIIGQNLQIVKLFMILMNTSKLIRLILFKHVKLNIIIC